MSPENGSKKQDDGSPSSCFSFWSSEKQSQYTQERLEQDEILMGFLREKLLESQDIYEQGEVMEKFAENIFRSERQDQQGN